MPGGLARALGRLRVRLLAVNLVVLLVPVAGLEFARVYERQLLGALERDMRNQAVLVRALLTEQASRGEPLDTGRLQAVLTRAAALTRTRIRVLDARGAVLLDSHADGPPEGPEPPPPTVWPAALEGASRRAYAASRDADVAFGMRSVDRETWPDVPNRAEVRDALAGRPSARTRIRREPPGVFLFVTEPTRLALAPKPAPSGGPSPTIRGAVYVVRSTQPVLVELYRIRAGLRGVLLVALVLTALLTLALAWTISRPLARLSRAAKRIASGERDIAVPVGGGGEIRELGESIAQMKQRLEDRLRYIEGFAADVAHEFKSPLTAIRGAAELLDEGAADDPAARRRFLQNIGHDVERLDRLVSRLLELSRLEASQEPPAVVDVEAVVRRAAARAETPDVPVYVAWHARDARLRAREVDLETALFNLFDNAVRFSPAGVGVRVTAQGAAGGALEIVIEDRGPGIAPEDLPRIFDRFFTTDRERQGTGLGLAIVQSVIRAHGGNVTVTSAHGHGACFRVRLPGLRAGRG
jgi:two-component system sensor histidine kinase ChvG